MSKCKGCGHDDFSHQGGFGKCNVVIIEKESEFYRKEIAEGVDAWVQDTEYGDECPCKVMITWMPRPTFKQESAKRNLDEYM